MYKPTEKRHALGLFSLVMFAIVSVDSLRNLPISAQYGFSLISFYLFAGLFFFLPLAWVAGKLAVQYPNTGGSYLWVKAAFGESFGYLAIWLQWLYNMIWYPTIFAFITATLASLIASGLETSKWFILWTSLGFFWLLSLLHCRGLRASSWISTGGALIGTLFPMFLMIGLAVYWLMSGKPSATPFSWPALLPSAHDIKNIGFFSNILFSLMGLEVIAMHAGNVDNPAQKYPRAFGISAVLILFTIVFSSLALCIIMPAEKIALVNGLNDVLYLFFASYQITNARMFIGICIIIGGLGIASSWMIGLARGLHVCLNSMNAPGWIRKLNKNDMPSRVLMMQAVVYSVLLCSFLLFPDINSSYWILSAITAQFALLYYVLLFCAALKLIRSKQETAFKRNLAVLLPVTAIVVCLMGIVAGFMPPDFVKEENRLKYELLLVAGFIFMGLIPVMLVKFGDRFFRRK